MQIDYIGDDVIMVLMQSEETYTESWSWVAEAWGIEVIDPYYEIS